MAGDSLRLRARCSRVVSRGIVDLGCVDRCLHAGDGCGKSPRTRYHLWLFRSRQSKLEFSFSFGEQFGDSRCIDRALGFEPACQAFADQAFRFAVLIRQTTPLSYNPNSTREVRFVCE